MSVFMLDLESHLNISLRISVESDCVLKNWLYANKMVVGTVVMTCGRGLCYLYQQSDFHSIEVVYLFLCK